MLQMETYIGLNLLYQQFFNNNFNSNGIYIKIAKTNNKIIISLYDSAENLIDSVESNNIFTYTRNNSIFIFLCNCKYRMVIWICFI